MKPIGFGVNCDALLPAGYLPLSHVVLLDEVCGRPWINPERAARMRVEAIKESMGGAPYDSDGSGLLCGSWSKVTMRRSDG